MRLPWSQTERRFLGQRVAPVEPRFFCLRLTVPGTGALIAGCRAQVPGTEPGVAQ